MASFMLAKLLPMAKAVWTEVDAIPHGTHRVCTLDSNRMGKVGEAAVALRLHAGFVDSCGDEGCEVT
jgi:hypothetical protein